MTGRHVRVFPIRLQGRRIRRTSSFLAPPDGGRHVDQEGRRWEGRSSIVKRANVFFLVPLRLLLLPALRPTVRFFQVAAFDFVGALRRGGILFIPCVLEVGKVNYALARERVVRDVR